ncbi:MAG: hypothetical protein KKA80_01590 [Candidatus Omnitrophica bacterium]|nr:hypothetical protein [Candidatus Omnitrophota bacterium]
MKKALLVIGDKKTNRRRINHSFVKFVKYARKLKESRVFELKVINYAQLLSGSAPAIEAAEILVVFFFPYKYWNSNIEIYPDARIYGDKKFGREFKIFFRKVQRTIDRYYGPSRIKYLNSPKAICLDRDKRASKDLLQRRKIPAPRLLKVCSFDDIQKLINKGLSLYIKPGFGALGKGITYVDRQGVISNFLFRKSKVVSRIHKSKWKFARIKEKERFLSKLLKKGFICEEAIESAVFRGRRFDFRIYVIFGNVVYLYAKSSPAEFYVTNWSQGGRIDKKKKILNALPEGKIDFLKKLAKRAARALGLNFTGIDIIFSKDLKSAYVLEGNAFPGYEKGFDLMKCLLDFLLK